MDNHYKTRHLPFLQSIADTDVTQLRKKDAEYGASWKSRGGVGAFMMAARKWDRLENMVAVARVFQNHHDAEGHNHTIEASKYDIFKHAAGSEAERGDAESLLDTIGDLRRYLLLIEAEIIAARPGAMSPAFSKAMDQGYVNSLSTGSDAIGALNVTADQIGKITPVGRDCYDSNTIDQRFNNHDAS